MAHAFLNFRRIFPTAIITNPHRLGGVRLSLQSPCNVEMLNNYAISFSLRERGKSP